WRLVSGRRREPSPPAMTTAFTAATSTSTGPDRCGKSYARHRLSAASGVACDTIAHWLHGKETLGSARAGGHSSRNHGGGVRAGARLASIVAAGDSQDQARHRDHAGEP